jgi:hypothetical protein
LVLKKKHNPDDMDLDDEDGPASAPIEPVLSKSKLKKMFTRIDPNKPRFGKLEEFPDEDDEAEAKRKADEPFIDMAVQSLKDRDAGDSAAYKAQLREKQKKKKDKKKADEEARRAKKNEFKAMLGGGGMGGAILGAPEGSDDDEGSNDEAEGQQYNGGSDSGSDSSDEAPKKKTASSPKQPEDIRRGKRKRPDESSSASNSDDEDSDDDKAAFATKRMKLEDQAKKILSKRLGK